MPSLRRFDAFSKVEKSYVNDRAPPSLVPYLFMFAGVFFLYLQTTAMIGAPTKYSFDVDNQVQSLFRINMKITLKSPCSDLGIYLQDASNDRLFVNELVQAVPFTDLATNLEYCQIAGSFETNRVRGQLTITPTLRRSTKFDASHIIHELSFGEYLPAMLNPLDDHEENFETPVVRTYFLNILPVTYQAMGIELETNRYTVTHSTHAVAYPRESPAIHCVYDFDPIHVTLTDNRLSFFGWLARVLNILGGIFFAVRALNKLAGRRLRGKTTGYNPGLLDLPQHPKQ